MSRSIDADMLKQPYIELATRKHEKCKGFLVTLERLLKIVDDQPEVKSPFMSIEIKFNEEQNSAVSKR